MATKPANFTVTLGDLEKILEQIRIADGKPLSVKQEDIEFNGHAIECRINAENPTTFAPSRAIASAMSRPNPSPLPAISTV